MACLRDAATSLAGYLSLPDPLVRAALRAALSRPEVCLRPRRRFSRRRLSRFRK